MPGPAWEDLSAFFDPNAFATEAVVTRGAEEVARILGIFDDPNTVASVGEYELDHSEPRFTCSEAEAADVRKGDIVTIDGQTFDLMENPKRDGTGIAVLILAERNLIYNAGV